MYRFKNNPQATKKVLNQRFSELVIKGQLAGLARDESKIELLFEHVRSWFARQPGNPEDKPRYNEDIPSEFFLDDKPKRICLSHYKEHKGAEFFRVGMNYGVLIGKTIVEHLGGHESVVRLIAVGGAELVLAYVLKLPKGEQKLMRDEIKELTELISKEKKCI